MTLTSPFAVFCYSYYVIFVMMHISLMIGIFLEWRRERKSFTYAEAVLPSVSVIIPVHNEIKRLSGLLDSLRLQDYPSAEYIFVDDRSLDGSAELLDAFVRERGSGNRIITLKENPGPNHKQFALARGIESSSGEFVLFTDADCTVPPRWIRGMVRRMSEKKAGATIGPVLKSPEGKGFFNLYQ